MTNTDERLALEQRASSAAARLPDLIASAEAAAQIVLAGRHPRQKAGRSDSFWQFRDYVLGDPVSSIDWRQSARLDRRLLVRQTEWEQPQTLQLWCGGTEDFDFTSGGETKRFRGQTIALATAIVALRAGERVGLWGGDEPARTGHHVAPLLADLLLRHDGNTDGLQPHTGALYLLISDFHEDPKRLEELFERIRDSRGTAIAVVVEDPAETSFPFSGSRRFEGPRGERRKFFGEAGAVREAYLAARGAHHDALRSVVRSSHEAVFFHRTDESIIPLLLQLSQQLSDPDR